MNNLIIPSAKTLFFTAIMVIVMMSSCKLTQHPQELVTIDVKKAYNMPARNIMLSELVEDIDYIKLETRSDCMISTPWSYNASENYIIVFDHITSGNRRVLLFTKEGKYLNNIGSRGKGPGEYSFVDPWTMEISPDEKYILLKHDWVRGIFSLYNKDGSFIKKWIIPPVRTRQFGYFGTDNFVSIKQSSDLSKSGNQLLIYDNQLSLVDSLMFSCPNTTMDTGWDILLNTINIYKGNVYFQQELNDTIFRIDQTFSISPHLVIDLGGLKIPAPIVPNSGMQIKYYQPHGFNTINNYDFIRLEGGPGNNDKVNKFLVYNRINAEAFFLDVSLDPYREDAGPILSIINDMDGVANPRLPYSQLVDKYIDALQIIDVKPYLESGAVNPKKLVTDKYYNELSKLLSESDIEDNPIIRIMHFK